MAVDLQAATAQAQKRELTEQVRLYEEAVSLWSQAVAQCTGRARERAQRNLADSQKVRASLSEQQGAGPQCAAAHKDAAAFQDMAVQAFNERRFAEAAMLFHKTEDMWEMASERCSGTQQELASRRREQSATDGHNAEHCAPRFEKAREQNQKLRASAPGMAREEKQQASLAVEALWRDALGQCKGAVLETVRNNIQALARERGTPWVASGAPGGAAPATTAMATATATATATAAASAASAASGSQDGAVARGVAPVAAPAKPGQPQAQPPEFTSGTTRYSGKFFLDAPDAKGYSGTGKITWANGDTYEGVLLRGQRHGKGVFTWADGQRYSGDWVNDTATGQGNLQFVSANQYEGEIRDGQPQGQGRMRYASGDIYTGLFSAGVPEGRGTYLWKSGQQIEGEWKNQQINGPGRIVFASGDTYVGELVDGKPHGKGTYHWTNGDEYVGQWKDGQKHGSGAFIWKNGDRWEGLYDSGEQTRQGKLIQKK